VECKICHGDACEHPRLLVHDGICECLDCGQSSPHIPPIKYALPFYEDKVDWNSGVYFPVCRNCYYKYTHDPRAYPLDNKPDGIKFDYETRKSILEYASVIKRGEDDEKRKR